tara:strand:+ start:16 stop:3015 length:3000 start_codon:yes stop_codon:yes gene_type:complete
MGIRGVWSLENVELKKPQDDWVEIPNVFTQQFLDDAGYIAGGETAPGPHTSRYDKIAYSTDTKSTLTQHMYCPRRGGGGSSSTTAGYLMGGFGPGVPNGPYSSSTDKLTYATQTTALVPSNFADTQTLGSAGGGSTTAGYLVRGSNPFVSYVRKITYATDSIELLPGRVPGPRGANAPSGSSGNGNQFLYILGGSDSDGSEVKKLVYSTDTTSSAPNMPTPGNLNRAQGAGCSSSTLAAYIVGGSNPYSSKIDKITFSNDTCSYVTNSTVPTNNGRFKVAGTGSPSAGYFSGGTSTSITEKITMSTENCSRIPALDLTSGLSQGTGFSAKGDNHPTPQNLRWFDGAAPAPSFALFAGGNTDTSPNNRASSVSKFTYATGTGSASATLPEETAWTCATGAPEAGYWKSGSGYPGPGTYWSFTQKVIWSTETASQLPSSANGGNPGWSSGRTVGGVAVSNTTKAFFGAGGPALTVSFANGNISVFPWATETFTTAPGANLRNSMMFVSSAGSQEHGYVFGGQRSNGDTPTHVEKIAYSNNTRSNGGNMSTYHYYSGSASSDTASYTFGGTNTSAIVEKYVWATDTCSADTNLSQPVENNSTATGKNDAGLIAGGDMPGRGDYSSSVQKYTYSTSTSSMEPGSLTYGARAMGGTSASNNNGPAAVSPDPTPTATTMSMFPATLVNFGLQQGHSVAPSGDEVRKIDFATEVGSELPARLPNARKDHCSFTSTLASYISGGSTPSSTSSSQIDKTVYATGTSSNVVNGSSDNLEPGRYRSGGAGNATNGWTMGGSPAKSRIDKFYYSSETNQGDGTWSNDGPGPNGRSWQSTLSAPSYIYAAGGGDRSNFWRFAFSISSQQEVPGATLLRTPGSPTSQGAEGQIAGLGNKIQGYVGGGNNPGSTGGSNPFMQKFVYATETATSLGEILTGSRYGVSNCGDLETGYFLGGSDAGTTGTGKTMKITYSSDTYALCPGANTASQKNRGHGSGAKSFGIHTQAIPITI